MLAPLVVSTRRDAGLASLGVKRFLGSLIMVMIVSSSCSSPPSLAEYAKEVESLVTSMNARLDAADDALDDEADLTALRDYVSYRIELRTEFLDSFRTLDPPEEVAELHATALDTITRLAAAESDVAAIVMDATTVEEARSAWDTAAGVAARAVDAETIAMCDAAQASLDTPPDPEVVFDGPWIPPDLKEVIEVAFGCHADER
jgi:hypothetical protein